MTWDLWDPHIVGSYRHLSLFPLHFTFTLSPLMFLYLLWANIKVLLLIDVTPPFAWSPEFLHFEITLTNNHKSTVQTMTKPTKPSLLIYLFSLFYATIISMKHSFEEILCPALLVLEKQGCCPLGCLLLGSPPFATRGREARE